LGVDLSGLEGGDAISVSPIGSAQLYRRCDDGLEIVVKLFGEFDLDENCEIETEIETLMNVMYLRIAVPFGFVLPTAPKRLKIGRLHTQSSSLNDVLSSDRFWWTPTTKTIAVA
jgi:hypothetical protein